MTRYFDRPITTDVNHMDRIVSAYRNAGLTPPTLGEDIKKKIQGVPSAEDVARELSREAFTAEDADTWHANAIERIRAAHAAALLRDEFNRSYPSIMRAATPGYLDEAAEDLRAPFDKLAKAFTQAVGQLPAGMQAFDAEAVIVADAGAALITGRDALSKFGAYAALFISPNGSGDYPVDLNKILPLVDLPSAVVEQVSGLGPETVNADQLGGTRVIRKLATDMRKIGADLVLAGVARGNYPGVTLSLATRETLRERIQTAVSAHARKRVDK